jgi:serine/threonine-protein kinase
MFPTVAPVVPQDPRIAQCLQALSSRYTVSGLLGEGGTAFVYLGTEHRSGRAVALKLMHPNLLHEPDSRAAFIREAELMEALDHPNIVSILEVIQLDSLGCALVMPFIDGFTLKQHVKASGPLAYGTVREVLRDLLGALEYAHGMGIAHRDIKPHNVFLDAKTKRCLLGDFGIAARLDEQVSPNSPDNMGTPQYMSPEHIDGRAVDQRSDIYSIGCVLYEMLTGLEPWGGLSLSEVLQRQRTDALPDVTTLRPDVPTDLQRLLVRAQAKDPSQRWQSASEMLAAIEATPSTAWSRNFTSRSAVSAAPASASPTASRRAFVPVAIALGVLLLVAGAWGMMSGGGGGDENTVPPVSGTLVDPSLLESAPSGTISEGPSQRSPAPEVPQPSPEFTPPNGAGTPARDVPPRQTEPERPTPALESLDAEARAALGRATQLSGSADGFDIIITLRDLAQSPQVTGSLRERLRTAAQDLSRQCRGAQLLDPSIQCP